MQANAPRILMDNATSVKFENGFIEYSVQSGGRCYLFCHTLHHAIATHAEMGRIIAEALAVSAPTKVNFGAG